jgi:glycosyltransferase involved in cell wall biosynthesis
VAPQFSIVVPTHNRPHLLPRAIRSVLAQQETDWELLVVNDGNVDVAELIAEITDRDARVRLLSTGGSRGAAHARNTGIAAAQGEIVCFMDDDDEMLPAYLSSVGRHMREKALDFTWVGVTRYRQSSMGRVDQETGVWDIDSLRPHSLSFVMQIAISYGLAVRRTCLQKHGGLDEALRVSDDREMMFRLIQAGCRYAAVPEALVRIHIQRRQSLSQFHDTPSRAASTAAEDEVIRTRYERLFDADPDLQRTYWKKIATKYYHARDTASYWKALRSIAGLNGLSFKVVWRGLIIPLRELLLRTSV